MSSIARDILFDDYVNKRMTDLEIAEKYGLTRTAISKMRKREGIRSKDFTINSKMKAHGFSHWEVQKLLRSHRP